MDFEKLFNDLSIKSENLEICMKMLPHKSAFNSQITGLDGDIKDIKRMEQLVKKSIDEHNTIIKEEYQETREIIQNINEKMLYLLEKIENLEPAVKFEEFNKNILSELKSPAPKLFDQNRAAAIFGELNTPRMSIEQYSKSPFMKKKSTKLQLKFSDFEADIKTEQFEKIPSYIRGRITLSDLQHFLDDIVIKCFNSKYELFYKNRACLKPSDYNLQLFYKEQASYFEGSKFITLGDLSRIMDKNVDKKDEKYLQCLRFLHIIKEARKNSATCYIWIEK